MGQWLLRRLLQTLPTLFAVATVVFLVMRMLPGDPAIAVLGEHATQESLLALRERMGLNVPLGQQYIEFMGRIVRGDLGQSIVNMRPIGPDILRVLPHTLELATASLVWGLLIGLPLGFISALRRNSIVDFAGRMFSLVGLSAPAFYFGILLLLLFSVRLDWFPVIGYGTDAGLWQRLYFVMLPSFALGLEMAAFVSRATRSTVIEVMFHDYVRTARAKGLREGVLLTKHVMRNALVSVVTVAGIYFGVILGGSVLVETVFSRPGLGKFLVEGIQSRDYIRVESGLLVYSVLIVAVNLIVDITYGLIDPRIRYN